MNLIEDSKLLNALIENDEFCGRMINHELALLKVSAQISSSCQVTSNQWQSIEEIAHDCTTDIAFKLLDLIKKMIVDSGMNESIEKQLVVFLQNEDYDIRKKVC